MYQKLISASIGAVAVIGMANSAFAQSSGAFNISATVRASETVCSFPAATLAFNELIPNTATPTDTTTDVQLSCTNPTVVTLTVPSTSGGNRTLTEVSPVDPNDVKSITYQLFLPAETDPFAATVAIWGDAIGDFTPTGPAAGQVDSTGITFELKGQVPAVGDVPEGIYNDALTVTMNLS